MNFQERVARIIRQNYPWLVADWNGAEYESMTRQVLRRLNAIEMHLRSIEERYAILENRLIHHANGISQHKAPRQKEPDADS